MNKASHLTSAQLDALLIGDRDDAAARHLQACPACAAEVAEVRSSLTLLSGAITGMAQTVTQSERFHHTTRTTLLAPPTRRPIVRLTATFALAASVAIVAAVLPVGRLMHPPTAHPIVATPTRTQESDEALLTEIDQQLSASVPQALEPLEDLAGNQAITTPSSNQSKNKKD